MIEKAEWEIERWVRGWGNERGWEDEGMSKEVKEQVVEWDGRITTELKLHWRYQIWILGSRLTTITYCTIVQNRYIQYQLVSVVWLPISGTYLAVLYTILWVTSCPAKYLLFTSHSTSNLENRRWEAPPKEIKLKKKKRCRGEQMVRGPGWVVGLAVCIPSPFSISWCRWMMPFARTSTSFSFPLDLMYGTRAFASSHLEPLSLSPPNTTLFTSRWALQLAC